MLNVLIACEESQAVCKEFRRLGHRAFSCDIQECSGGHPEWHIQGDALAVINGECTFVTADTHTHTQRGRWDIIIAHPPCTYLTTAATQCHSTKVYTKEQIADRTMKRIESMEFFMKFVNAKCDHIAIENPTGVMSACYRQPDQTIEPYWFAKSEDDEANYATKRTGLWLKGLPDLIYNCTLPNPLDSAERWANGKKKNWTENNHGGKNRSKTFPGVAKAMAEQWSEYVEKGDLYDVVNGHIQYKLF